MNLPNAGKAIVERSKIVDYLLAFDHPEGSGKAEFFTRFGFTVTEGESLANALIAHARLHSVSSISETMYGTKYCVDGSISSPDGRSPNVRAVWVVDAGTNFPRLVTAYPL